MGHATCKTKFTIVWYWMSMYIQKMIVEKMSWLGIVNNSPIFSVQSKSLQQPPARKCETTFDRDAEDGLESSVRKWHHVL